MRVAFLVGSDSASTRESIEAVCRMPGVEPVAILLDTHVPAAKVRWRNLWRNMRREGLGYAPRRVLLFVREALDAVAERSIVPAGEVDALLRAAYPERNFNLEQLASRYPGCKVERAGNLNGPLAADRLKALQIDLGIVLGTRVLKRHTFSAPRLGSVNLHKGEVPRFRGMPPAFWELYEGVPHGGVTVHFVDDGLDTGDILGTGKVEIHPQETLSSLKRKLDERGSAVLAEVVGKLAAGTLAKGEPQPKSATQWPTRTRPTRAQVAELDRKLPSEDQESDLRRIFKTAFHLGLYYSGVWKACRTLRRRGAIVLHHRVNDRSEDRLTTHTRVLAGHLAMLRARYHVIRTSELVALLRSGKPVPSGAIAIHFDDCYRDVYQMGAPLLKAAGTPGMMFIATGFIDTERIFEHDRLKYPLRFENLHREEVAALPSYGMEIGAHTVNHIDLGSIELEKARWELSESKRVLEEILGQPVPLFSFPFGKSVNIREDVRQLVRETGFDALFSAYGGYVYNNADLYNIERFGANSRYRPLDLMMEIEGISLAHWARRLRGQ